MHSRPSGCPASANCSAIVWRRLLLLLGRRRSPRKAHGPEISCGHARSRCLERRPELGPCGWLGASRLCRPGAKECVISSDPLVLGPRLRLFHLDRPFSEFGLARCLDDVLVPGRHRSVAHRPLALVLLEGVASETRGVLNPDPGQVPTSRRCESFERLRLSFPPGPASLSSARASLRSAPPRCSPGRPRLE